MVEHTTGNQEAPWTRLLARWQLYKSVAFAVINATIGDCIYSKLPGHTVLAVVDKNNVWNNTFLP